MCIRDRSKAELVAVIQDCCKDLIGTVPKEKDPLMSAGFDSLSSNDLVKKLGIEFEMDMPSTLLFDHPTVGGIADYLLEALPDLPAPVAAAPLAGAPPMMVAAPAAPAVPALTRGELEATLTEIVKDLIGVEPLSLIHI